MPAKTETFTVETFAEGLTGAFSFHFLPDGRIIVGERGGRIKIVGRDGKVSEPLGGLPEIFVGGPQGLFEVQPDKAFAANRTLYLTYTALPEGADRTTLPRAAGLLMVASAKLSADDKKLEGVKDAAQRRRHRRAPRARPATAPCSSARRSRRASASTRKSGCSRSSSTA